jgi:aspartate kinase
MGLIVQKFGGTSVGSPDKICAVANRIARTYQEGHRLVIVVSAMGHTTDELIDLAYKVSPTPLNREMDMLLTAGERISMALLSMALADRGVRSLSFTGSQSGIITDESHRRARIKRILGDRVRSALHENKVAIVAGFQGVSETKEITTLGRGGSDTTAVALAAVLGADACEIYTDVDGVFSADPRIIPEAKLWERISHDIMVELATRGAGVLHPRSVELAKQYGVVLRVKNSFNQKEGTEVVSQGNMEEFRIVGVTSDQNKALLTVELMRSTVLNAIWDFAAGSHLAIIAPAFFGNKVQFFVERDAEEEWRKSLQRLAVEGFVKEFDLDLSLVPVSVVGDRLSQDGAALYQIGDALAKAGVSVSFGSASALSFTVAVPKTHIKEAIQALHDKFLGNT